VPVSPSGPIGTKTPSAALPSPLAGRNRLRPTHLRAKVPPWQTLYGELLGPKSAGEGAASGRDPLLSPAQAAMDVTGGADATTACVAFCFDQELVLKRLAPEAGAGLFGVALLYDRLQQSLRANSVRMAEGCAGSPRFLRPIRTKFLTAFRSCGIPRRQARAGGPPAVRAAPASDRFGVCTQQEIRLRRDSA